LESGKVTIRRPRPEADEDPEDLPDDVLEQGPAELSSESDSAG
jgi:hypothetical protein